MLNISLQCIGHQLNRSGSQNFKYPTVFLELTSVDKLTTETSGKLPVLLMMSALRRCRRFQKMSDCETDCAAVNLSSCTLAHQTPAPHLLAKVEVDGDGCFNEAAYLAQVVLLS